MLSMAQFGGEMADDRIGRLIAEAESSRPAAPRAQGSRLYLRHRSPESGGGAVGGV